MSNTAIHILYHVTDAYFAARIAADLKLAGLRVFLDIMDTYGEEEVVTARTAAVAYIPLLSPAFISPADIDLAGSNTFPVIIGDLPAWPKEIRRELAIDFTGWEQPVRYAAHIKELMRVLQLHLADVAADPLTERQRYLTELMAALYRGRAGYVPLPVYAEPIEEVQAMSEAGLVLEVGDNLAERIARNAEVAAAMAASDQAGLMALPDVTAMMRYTTAFIITAISGAGKTTALHALALESARRAMLGDHFPLPIVLDLATWRDGTKFHKFLQESIGIDVRALIAEQKYELFLDNLHQTGGRNWAWLSRWLESEDPPNTVIMTVDANRYNDELELPIVTLGRLSEEQLTQWWQLRTIKGQDVVPLSDLATVARLPFYMDLALHAIARGELPADNAATLIAAEVQARLRLVPEVPDLAEKLALLATAVIDDDEGVYVDLNWAQGKLSGKRGFLRRRGGDENSAAIVDAALRTRLLDRHADQVRFAHDLYRGYFAALALTQQGVGGSVRAPSFDNGRRMPTLWDEPVLLACLLTSNADEMVQEVNKTDPFLAAMCIVNGATVSEQTTAHVRATLVTRLEQNDWRITTTAVKALRDIGEPALVELMIENLAYGDVYERRMAARVLGEIQHPAAVPVLAEAMQDETIRQVAQVALSRIGEPATDEVIQLLDPAVAERWETRAGAAQILRAIASPKASEALVGALFDDEYEVRWSVANALSELGKEAVPQILNVIHSEQALGNDDIIVAAASALVWMDDSDALEHLATELSDASAIRRARVAEVLGGTTNAVVIAPLIATLKDTTRVTLDDETISVAEIAAESLEQIGTPDALMAVEQWRRNLE